MGTWKRQLYTGRISKKDHSLLNRIFKDNGGVTFSGGEPLMQPEFLLETCKLLKQEGIHIALDTAGVGLGDYRELLHYIDLIILDIKHVTRDGYLDLTGHPIDDSLSFIQQANSLEKHIGFDKSSFQEFKIIWNTCKCWHSF